MTLAWSVSWPGTTGNRAAMAWAGVRWFFPPKGIRTLPAPMEPSNRSVRPRREAHFRLAAISREGCRSAGLAHGAGAWLGLGTDTLACFTAPLVFRNARDRSAMVWPFQCMTIRGLSVTTAT